MTRNRDPDLVERIRSGRAVGVVVAEDPAAVAAEVARDPGVALVDLDALPCAIAAARVHVAGLVVDRAREAEGRVASEPSGARRSRQPVAGDAGAADREAVRFALVILLPALPAGVAVYLADGLLLAPALPAVALLALGAVVLVNRRGGHPPRTEAAACEPAGPASDVEVSPDVEASPSVRAARAHLRRQEAAWKVTWWERDQVVPALDGGPFRVPATIPVTLVAIDPDDTVDGAALATMTAAAPAAVRVVVLQAR